VCAWYVRMLCVFLVCVCMYLCLCLLFASVSVYIFVRMCVLFSHTRPYDFVSFFCLPNMYTPVCMLKQQHLRSYVHVQVSSLAGVVGLPYRSVYSGTKHALEALSDALRQEMLKFGVSVSVIEPGFVRTPILEKKSVYNVTDVERDLYWVGCICVYLYIQSCVLMSVRAISPWHSLFCFHSQLNSKVACGTCLSVYMRVHVLHISHKCQPINIGHCRHLPFLPFSSSPSLCFLLSSFHTLALVFALSCYISTGGMGAGTSGHTGNQPGDHRERWGICAHVGLCEVRTCCPCNRQRHQQARSPTRICS